MSDEERDIKNEAFCRNLAANFAKAKTILGEKAEEFGIDLNAISTEKFDEYRSREDEIIKSDDLTKLTNQYAKDSRKLLEDQENWLIFSTLDKETQDEMLSIISWYQYFISAKLQRGLSGTLDFDGNLDEEKLNDSQSDANGSIKIVTIAISR